MPACFPMLACDRAGIGDSQRERAKLGFRSVSQAMGLAARGELGQAEILLEQARTAAPHNTEVLTALAKVKDRVGESQDAIAIFRQVADATPRSGEAHLNLAMALADSKDLTGALDEATKAVELAPKLASAH